MLATAFSLLFVVLERSVLEKDMEMQSTGGKEHFLTKKRIVWNTTKGTIELIVDGIHD